MDLVLCLQSGGVKITIQVILLQVPILPPQQLRGQHLLSQILHVRSIPEDVSSCLSFKHSRSQMLYRARCLLRGEGNISGACLQEELLVCSSQAAL